MLRYAKIYWYLSLFKTSSKVVMKPKIGLSNIFDENKSQESYISNQGTFTSLKAIQ